MKLHNNKNSFIHLIKIVSDYYKIEESLIEKDYYVTLLLKELSLREPKLIFKGGTSLSKCYNIINRFSEDIDLTLDNDNQSQGNKRNFKNKIIESCNLLNLKITNLDKIKSRRIYNCYEIEYPNLYQSNKIKSHLIVETTYITKSYPSEYRFVTSIIFNYLTEIGDIDAIKKYDLVLFKIKVQSLERTLIDKVFAICDYMIGNKIQRNSRHIYDIYQLVNTVSLNKGLKELVIKVREERIKIRSCFSARYDIEISDLLNMIIKSNIYKFDYENVTKEMLYKYIPYEESIKSLSKIIESKVFDIKYINNK